MILHEDAHCLAVVKPPGQFTQGEWAPPDEITLETAVRRHLDPADPGAVYLGIVHRLDRPTSGLLIWAKTPKAARRLASQFELRKVFKEYWAVVESGPGPADDDAWPRRRNLDRLADTPRPIGNRERRATTRHGGPRGDHRREFRDGSNPSSVMQMVAALAPDRQDTSIAGAGGPTGYADSGRSEATDQPLPRCCREVSRFMPAL